MSSPMPSESTVIDQLDRLFSDLLQQADQQHSRKPLCDFDEEWPSDCHLEGTQEDSEQGLQIQWQPVKQQPIKQLSGLVKSLELSVHQDFQDYIGAYHSECLPAIWSSEHEAPGSLTLIFCNSDQDLDLMQQNLLGHSLAKQKNKQEQNWFFATTDNDMVICLNQETGEVELEKPGYKPERVLAASLSTFLADCQVDQTRI
ncbi:SecY-interacting protein Syd [Pelagibaculum spongiae]|nr:SecY-interacting protein Syd [Pelagibaculum spongiae]